MKIKSGKIYLNFNVPSLIKFLFCREEEMVGEYGLYYDKHKMTQEEEEDDEHPDIRHTAPQHRQYLGSNID